jgi:hypothetical protein
LALRDGPLPATFAHLLGRARPRGPPAISRDRDRGPVRGPSRLPSRRAGWGGLEGPRQRGESQADGARADVAGNGLKRLFGSFGSVLQSPESSSDPADLGGELRKAFADGGGDRVRTGGGARGPLIGAALARVPRRGRTLPRPASCAAGAPRAGRQASISGRSLSGFAGPRSGGYGASITPLSQEESF